jgi:chromosome partitioning protein
MKYEQDGLNQVTMALISGVAPATISRCVTSKQIYPIPAQGKRNLRYSIRDSQSIIGSVSLKKVIKKKVHAFYNFKGGTGKTSICYQVATHLALMGYRTLAIDTDPQAHLTSSFGVEKFENKETLYDCIVKGRSVDDVIVDVFPQLSVIPSNLSLTRLEPELNNMARREERLFILMQSVVKDYDFILVDTNPTISVLNRNVIVFSDCLNIVTETQPFSLMGLKYLNEDLQNFYTQMQLAERVLNVIPNKYEDRSSNSAEAMAMLKKYYEKHLKPDFAIRKSEEIINSSKMAKPLSFFVKKNSIALEDVLELTKYIIEISMEPEHEKTKI